MRKIAAIVLASAFVVSVAACSDLPAEQQGCAPVYSSADASKSINAPGPFGQDPKAKIPTPLVSHKIEATVTTPGTGFLIGKDDVARVTYSLYTAEDGQRVLPQGKGQYAKANETLITAGAEPAQFFKVLGNSVLCQRVGARIVTVLTAADYFGGKSAATSQGIAADTPLVSVADIRGGFRGRATGILQPLQSGFPSVVTAGDGTPGLTLDLQEPPKTLQWELVRGGSGARIKAGQQVLLQVQAVSWTNPPPTTTFDSTWTDHTPRFYTLKAFAKNAGGDSLDPGSVKALVGQKVGSQVLVVVPPKYGYPSGKAPSGYPSKTTLIFVYDILGTY
ncbi:MAG: FKBP-type peptidyl-prolyl cis-trans isomerase [Galbitalea sp.]